MDGGVVYAVDQKKIVFCAFRLFVEPTSGLFMLQSGVRTKYHSGQTAENIAGIR